MLAKDFHDNGQKAVRHPVHGIGIASGGPVSYVGRQRVREFGDDFVADAWFETSVIEAKDNRKAIVKVPIAELTYLSYAEDQDNRAKWMARKKAEFRSRVTEDAVLDLVPEDALIVAPRIAQGLYIDPDTCEKEGIVFVDGELLDASVVTRTLEKLVGTGRLERIKEKELPNTVRVSGSTAASWCYGHPGTIKKLQQLHVEIVDERKTRQARFEKAFLDFKALYPEGYADYDAESRTSSVRVDLESFLALVQARSEIAKAVGTDA